MNAFSMMKKKSFTTRVGSILPFLAPYLCTAALYKSQHGWADGVRNLLQIPVRVVEPWAFDRAYFGVETAQGILTPNEWWRMNTHPFLDLLSGFFYLFFILIFIGIALAFYLRGKSLPCVNHGRILKSASFGFFVLNAIGYITYFLYPAAPPWYVELRGFGPIDWSVAAHPAGAEAFDRLVGVPFFKSMYGLSADVFGAVPSLHVAYPA